MLKQRVITAVAIVVPLLAALVWLEPAPLMALFALVVVGAAWG